MEINLTFQNQAQELFFWHRERNGHFGGGMGNGKSYVACQRAFVHLMTFPRYGMVIARQVYKQLRSTTMKTFFKICPPELVLKHDENFGYTILVNGSFIYWMHLDDAAEPDLRGLEVNSVMIDQVEEVNEGIAAVLDIRVGRWDLAQVPNHLLLSQVKDEDTKLALAKITDKTIQRRELEKYTTWPRHPKRGHFSVPNYFDCLSNPLSDFEFHWVYRNYYPESGEALPGHFHISRQTDDNLNDAGSITKAKSRHEEWVDLYYYGKVGSTGAIIHKINPASIIVPSSYSREVWDEFIQTLLKRAALYRALDHAETGITACVWEAVYKKVFIFYREYYQQGKLISDHRQAISDLSLDEEYLDDLADPQIFKKGQQKNGQFWTVAKEYADSEDISAPAFYWNPADNNEYATRNRINELLRLDPLIAHPITDELAAPTLDGTPYGFPRIYYIEADKDLWPHGCIQTVWQTKNARRTLVGELDGKKIYSEERDEAIVDHAYDCERYHVANHNTSKAESVKAPPKRSFAYYNAIMERKKQLAITF